MKTNLPKKQFDFVAWSFVCCFLSACGDFSIAPKSETTGIFEASNSLFNFQLVRQQNKIQIDSTLTATAEFIAGIPNEALPYARQRHYYQRHLAQTEHFRKQVIRQQIIPIRNWAKKYHISEISDSVTLFYPFGEGNFLQAYTLFPNCENYILTGDKLAGEFPDLTYTADPILEDYLVQLRKHLKISNIKENSDNQKDTSQKYFDSYAVIHQVLFHLAHAGRKIIAVSAVKLDNFGEERNQVIPTKKQSKQSFIGFKIQFCALYPEESQNLYYFNISISDSSLKKYPQFEYFLTDKGEKITFLHSENYGLHTEKYSKIRNLILNQSVKILSDESGIPYLHLNNKNFKSKLYGVPSSLPKNVFRSNWKKGIDYEERGDLPFDLKIENRPVTALLFGRLYPEISGENFPEISPKRNVKSDTFLAEITTQSLPAPTVSRGSIIEEEIKRKNTDNQYYKSDNSESPDTQKTPEIELKNINSNIKKSPSKTSISPKKTIPKTTSKPKPRVTKKQVIKIGKENSNLVRYKVQIGIYSNELNPRDTKLQGLPKLDFYKSNGNYRYTAGNETSREACLSILQKVKGRGFSGAFIIAFRNGKRISLNDAEKWTKSNTH